VSGSLLQFHELKPVIAGAQSVAGKVLVWLAGCALLRWHHVDPPMFAAFTLVMLFPQYRRAFLALAALGLIALRFLPRDVISLSHLGASLRAVSTERWVEFAASASLATAVVILLVAAAIRFARLPALVRARPLLWLHLLAGIALVAGARWRIEVLALAPFLLWRASYLFKSAAAGRTAGTKLQDHLLYLVPVFGGSNTPYGKGFEYLGRCEARTAEANARSQLVGLRLLALAVVLQVLLELMFAVVHGRTDTVLFRASLAPWSLGLPTLGDILAGTANPAAGTGWLAVYLELIRTTTQLAVFGHIFIGSLRLLGFNAFRNTYKPLYATSIVEFWNRYYYYFKELLVEMFFYPAFYRAGWASQKLRMLVAVFAAAFAGNAYFHLLRDYEPVLAGDWPAVQTYWIPRLTYCALLAFGIWLSMLRQQKLRRDAGRPTGWLVQLRGMAFVWTFFGLLHTWLVEPPVAGALRRVDFFSSLAGL
jgi:hypothetical protein